MLIIDSWKKRSIKTISDVLSEVEPQKDETGEALYERAVAAVKARSWSAYLALMLFWRLDYRCLAGNYVDGAAKRVPAGVRFRKATPEERAVAERFGSPYWSWVSHEQFLRRVA